MTAKSATESALGELHNKVAKVMTNILNNVEIAQERWVEADEEIGPPPELSPAMLSAMTKFLSDNKITCQPEESESMSELDVLLKSKRKRRAIGNIVPLHPEDDT